MCAVGLQCIKQLIQMLSKLLGTWYSEALVGGQGSDQQNHRRGEGKHFKAKRNHIAFSGDE